MALNRLNSNGFAYHDLPPKKEMGTLEKIGALFLAVTLAGGATFMWVANGTHMFTFNSGAEGVTERFFAVVGTVGAFVSSLGWMYEVNKTITPHRTITEHELSVIKTNDSIDCVRNLLGRSKEIRKRELIGKTLSIEKWERDVDLTKHVREGRLTKKQKEDLCAHLEAYSQAVERLQHLQFIQQAPDNQATNYAQLNDVIDTHDQRQLKAASDAVDAFVREWPQKQREIIRSR